MGLFDNINTFQRHKEKLKNAYGLTNEELDAIVNADEFSGNIRKGDYSALKKTKRSEITDSKIRALGIGAGLAAAATSGMAASLIAQTPKSAKIAPVVAAPVIGGLLAKTIMHEVRKNRDSLNSALDKLNKHASDDPGTKDTMLIGAGLGGIGGSKLVSDAWHSGDLTGRMTLHHGTAAKNIPSIRDIGLLGTTSENAVNTSALRSNAEQMDAILDAAKKAREGQYFGKGLINLQLKPLGLDIDDVEGLERKAKILHKRYDDSLDKVYTTKNRLGAVGYAAQGELGGVLGGAREASLWDYAKAYAKSLFGGKGMVTLNVPVDRYGRVPNPELYEYPFEEFRHDHSAAALREDPANLNPTAGAAREFNGLADAVVLDTPKVEPTFVVGSEHYKGNTPKEFAEYVSKHPKSFARGVGRASAGTAALLGSAYLAHRALSN